MQDEMALHCNLWAENEREAMKQKASQGFPDILEIVQKSRSGEEPCDDHKFSEIHGIVPPEPERFFL